MATADKTRAPKLDTKNWPLFKLKLMAYLATKDGADIALSEPRPKLASAESLLEVTSIKKRNAKMKELKRKIKAWDTADRVAYYALIESAEGNPTANIMILDTGHKALAFTLFTAFEKRYNVIGNNLVQSKLSYFNSLLIKSGETSIEFADRIVETRLELKNMGVSDDVISKDIHCLGRLKEGLAGSKDYKDIAMKFMVESNLTWDDAIKSLTIFDGSICLRDKLKTESSQIIEQSKLVTPGNPLGTEAVKRVFHGKPKQGNQFCKICKKKGHRASECWHNKSGSKNSNPNSFKTNLPVVCHRCGKKGHIAPNCRTRRREESNESNAYDNFSDAKRPKTNYPNDLKYDLVRMLAHNSRNLESKNDVLGCLDSGATMHVMCLSTMQNLGCNIIGPVDMSLRTASTDIELKVIGTTNIGMLENIAVVDDNDLIENIISIAQLAKSGFKTMFGNNEAALYDNYDNLVYKCKLDASNSYHIPLSILTGNKIETVRLASVKPKEDAMLVHKRLGHKCIRDLHHGQNNNLFTGLPSFKNDKLPLCEACVRGKSSRLSYNHGNMTRMHRGNFIGKSIIPLENVIRKIVTDIKGPFSVPAYNGDKYLQLFTEKDTKFIYSFTMSSKSHAEKNLNALLDEMKILHQTIDCYHADGGPELIGENIKKILISHGCRITYSPPYTPQLNGQAERMNQKVWQTAYTLLLDCCIPMDLWPYAVKHAVMLCNMLPTKGNLDSKSPMEVKFGIVPNLSMFKVFGCRAYIHIPQSTRTSTFSDRAYKGYFIGFKSIYELEHILVFVPELNKVETSMNVIFDEIETVSRNHLVDGIILDERSRSINDFTYLINMIYRDNDNSCLYVVTRIGISHSFIVAYVARIQGNSAGPEESSGIHIREVEKMVKEFHQTNHPLVFSNGEVTNLAVLQHKSSDDLNEDHETAGVDTIRSDQPFSSTAVGRQTDHLTSSATGFNSYIDDNLRTNVSTNVVNVNDTNTLQSRKRKRQQRQVMNATTLGDVRQISENPLDVETVFERFLRISNSNYVYKPYIPKPESEYVNVVDKEDDTHSFWTSAKTTELHSLIVEHHTWDAVPGDPSYNLISAKWVVKLKTHPVSKQKARLTARGFSQVQGLDYEQTFAPVSKMSSMRVFLSLVGVLNLHTYQLDIKTAFLNAPLEEVIYVKPVYDHVNILDQLLLTRISLSPQVMNRLNHEKRILTQQNGVLRLRKALYGLKQAPRAWWQHFNDYILRLGFRQNSCDACFYVYQKSSDEFAILLIYVDDVLLGASQLDLLMHFVNQLRNKFTISSEGPIETFLNIRINRNIPKRTVTLCMSSYMEKVFQKFSMTPNPSVCTPVQDNLDVALAEEENTDISDTSLVSATFAYREKLGSLLYYMIIMRPDLMYVVHMLARFNNRQTTRAAATLTRALHYAYNTRQLYLTLGGTKAHVTGYSDANFAACLLSRVSISSFIVYLGTGPIEWGSKKQCIPATSTAVAEIVATERPIRVIQWIRNLLHNTGISSIITNQSSFLYIDNSATITFLSNPINSEKTRHVATKYKYGIKLAEVGVITYEKVHTSENPADLGTKVLSPIHLYPLRLRALGGVNPHETGTRKPTEISDEFV